MLCDVVDALRAVPALGEGRGGDAGRGGRRALRAARGAEVLLRPDPGLNAAIDAAAAIARAGRGRRRAGGARRRRRRALRRDRAPAPRAARPRRRSGRFARRRHLCAAARAARRDPGRLRTREREPTPGAGGARAGVACVEPALPSLAIDVDEPEDLAEPARAARGRAPRRSCGAGRGGPGMSASKLCERLRMGCGSPPCAASRWSRRATTSRRCWPPPPRAPGSRSRSGVLVVCQKVVSKAEGRLVALAERHALGRGAQARAGARQGSPPHRGDPARDAADGETRARRADLRDEARLRVCECGRRSLECAGAGDRRAAAGGSGRLGARAARGAGGARGGPARRDRLRHLRTPLARGAGGRRDRILRDRADRTT